MLLEQGSGHPVPAAATSGEGPVPDAALPAGGAPRLEDGPINLEQLGQAQGRLRSAQEWPGEVLPGAVDNLRLAPEDRPSIAAADLRRGAGGGQAAELLRADGDQLFAAAQGDQPRAAMVPPIIAGGQTQKTSADEVGFFGQLFSPRIPHLRHTGGAVEMKPRLPEGGFFNLAVARDQALEKLASLDPEILSRNAAVDYLGQEGCYRVPFLDRLYRVAYPGGSIGDTAGQEAPVYQSILILHYLVTADGKPLSGNWISYRHLPGGDIYTEPFRRRAVSPFLQAYGSDPASFVGAATALGGIRREGSGISMIIPVFPRVPLNFTLWPGDDELPASAAILFDSQAPSYLPTEDYAHLPALVVEAMRQR